MFFLYNPLIYALFLYSLYFSVSFTILRVFLNVIDYDHLYIFGCNIILHIQCKFILYLMLVPYMHAIFTDEVSVVMR